MLVTYNKLTSATEHNLVAFGDTEVGGSLQHFAAPVRHHPIAPGLKAAGRLGGGDPDHHL